MEIDELEYLMQKHGLAIRAIPLLMKSIYDKEHIDEFPNGKIEYVEHFQRAMCVVYEPPQNAGKFMIEKVNHTYSQVNFKNKYFDTIEDAIEYIIKNFE